MTGRRRGQRVKRGGFCTEGAGVREAAAQPPLLFSRRRARVGAELGPRPGGRPAHARRDRPPPPLAGLAAGLRVRRSGRYSRSRPGAGEPSGLEGGRGRSGAGGRTAGGRLPCPPLLRKMVFESVVVDVLNRFLGDYVVNLDTSQLTLGIWGGNETATAPLSRFPPGPWLPEPGFAFSGPRAPPSPGATTCRRLPRS